MKLRERILLLTGSMLVLTAYGLDVESREIVLARFQRMEQASVVEAMSRALDALSGAVNNLDSRAKDWAQWDDTYDFIADSNEHYKVSNLNIDSLTSIRLDVMAYINEQAGVVFEAGIDAAGRRFLPFPSGARGALEGGSAAFQRCMRNKPVSGLFMLPEGPLMVSARPILPSRGIGPVRGMLVMGCRLDERSLRRITHQLMSVVPATDVAGATACIERGRNYLVKPLSDGVIAGYCVVPDIRGQPTAMIRVVMPRDIVTQGYVTLNSFLLALIVAGLLATAAITALFDGFVLIPLARLRMNIEWMTARNALSERLPVKGGDEMALTAQEINRLLDVLEKIHQGAEAARRTHHGGSGATQADRSSADAPKDHL